MVQAWMAVTVAGSVLGIAAALLPRGEFRDRVVWAFGCSVFGWLILSVAVMA